MFLVGYFLINQVDKNGWFDISIMLNTMSILSKMSDRKRNSQKGQNLFPNVLKHLTKATFIIQKNQFYLMFLQSSNLRTKTFFPLLLFFFFFSCAEKEPRIDYEYYKTGEKKEEKIYDYKTKSYNGLYKKWHKNGVLGMQGNLYQSQKNGLFTYYDVEGWKNCEATFKLDKRWGNWYYFNELGDTTKILVYEGGTRNLNGYEPAIDQKAKGPKTKVNVVK